jgi:hypothetical protein
MADDDTGPKRMVVTITPEAAEATRKMAAKMGCSSPEAIRRALSLLDLVLDLDGGQVLAVHDPKTGLVDRLRFVWSAP